MLVLRCNAIAHTVLEFGTAVSRFAKRPPRFIFLFGHDFMITTVCCLVCIVTETICVLLKNDVQ